MPKASDKSKKPGDKKKSPGRKGVIEAPKRLIATPGVRYLKLLRNEMMGVCLYDQRDAAQFKFPGFRVVRVLQALWDTRAKKVVELLVRVYGRNGSWNGPRAILRNRKHFTGECCGVILDKGRGKTVPVDQHVRSLYKRAKETPEVASKKPATVPAKKTSAAKTKPAPAPSPEPVPFEEDAPRELPLVAAETYDTDAGVSALPYAGPINGTVPDNLTHELKTLLAEKSDQLDLRPSSNDVHDPQWWLTVGDGEKATFYFLVGYGPSQPKPVTATVLHLVGYQKGTKYVGLEEIGDDAKAMAKFSQDLAVAIKEMKKPKPEPVAAEPEESFADTPEDREAADVQAGAEAAGADVSPEDEDPLAGFEFLKGL